MKREGQIRLQIVPCTLAEANEFVLKFHRHHGPVVGYRFAIAAADETETIRGVAIVGRPVARFMDDGWTLEVNRLATDGCQNACSALYSGSWRAARALGYKKLITYTLAEEGGGSLRGAGWKCIGLRGGGSWTCKSRPRIDKHPLGQKLLWEVGT